MDPHPHDLLRLDPGAFGLPDDAPAWAARELARPEPWVVVRRAAAGPGMAAVGVRGGSRRERWALSVPLSRVRERVTPGALARGRRWTSLPPERGGLPAFVALETVAFLLGERGLGWGPGGSVGYELASGLSTVTRGSDLDLILYSPRPLPRAEAREVLDDLAPLPVRVDAQVDSGSASFSLSEWAAGGEVLLRRAGGPILTTDPWAHPGPSRSAAPSGARGR